MSVCVPVAERIYTETEPNCMCSRGVATAQSESQSVFITCVCQHVAQNNHIRAPHYREAQVTGHSYRSPGYTTTGRSSTKDMGVGASIPKDVHVVIVGGGYGGTELALGLQKAQAKYTLIDRTDSFQHTVAAVRAISEEGTNSYTDVPGRAQAHQSLQQPCFVSSLHTWICACVRARARVCAQGAPHGPGGEMAKIWKCDSRVQ